MGVEKSEAGDAINTDVKRMAEEDGTVRGLMEDSHKRIKDRILTGMRPSGKLHLGHYVGALENWLKLQEQYDCQFLIADYQAFGDHLKEIEMIRDSVIQVALDWLAVGLDPEKTSFVVQSYVPESAELTLLLSMLVPLGRLERNPTLKNEIKQIREGKGNESISVGFYSYPVSQAADILLAKADLVPVGEDQLPHIEMTREIAKKFNKTYGKIFPIPRALVGRIPRLAGVDGKAKMSKSLGNCIYLSDDKQTVLKKVNKMYTDPTRIHADDPGHIEGNVVFMYLEAFHQDERELTDLKQLYTDGKLSDGELKQILASDLLAFLKPIGEKRAFYQQHPELVRKALIEGSMRAKEEAEKTMGKVKDAMRITNY